MNLPVRVPPLGGPAGEDTEFRPPKGGTLTSRLANRVLAGAATALLLLLAALPSQAALFTNFVNEFAPANWAVNSTLSYNPGSFTFSGDNTIMYINGSATPGSDITVITLQSPYPTHDMTFGFSWQLVKNGDQSDPIAFYYVGGVAHELVGTSGTINSISDSGGTSISFELDSNVTSGKTPAQLEIFYFGGDMVPEVGTWLAGVFLAGVGAFEFWRQKRRNTPPSRTDS